MEKIEETNFYSYVKEFFEREGKTFKSIQRLREHAPPFDSIDRFFALYIIDKYPSLLDTDMSNRENINEVVRGEIPQEIREEFQIVTGEAYDNYEREDMSPNAAYANLLYIAKKGRDFVLKDSYSAGGWFGAS